MIDLKTTTTAQKNLLKRIESRDWLENNLRELQEQYADSWIAIAGEKVVAHGKAPDEVKEKIRAAFRLAEVLLIKVPKGEISQPV